MIAIGSGPAGLSAAETFRRHHPRIPVRIIATDPALPYARPPLSKDFLCGRQPELVLHTADWFTRHGIDLLRGVRVVRIDVDNQQVVTAAGTRHSYWHLVVATGAAVVPLEVPGGDEALYLRSLGDAVALRMAALHAESAVVIGGGLIGCEAASGLAANGISTTIVAGEDVPLQRRFGCEAGQYVAKMLSDIGVRFVGPAGVTEVCDEGVVLDIGATVDADLVVAATGVRSASGLAEAAGIEVRDGRIVVDERMHSSVSNVYAAGDVALAWNVTAGRHIPAEHWHDAIRQGAIAGSAAAGYPTPWGGVPEFCCTIGQSTLKYRGWGDGYERSRLVEDRDGFTVTYEAGAETVGVLRCEHR